MGYVLRYAWLEFLSILRNPVSLIFLALFPICFFALWAALNMGGSNVDFVARWLTPAAINWTIMTNTIMNLGIQIPTQRDARILKRLRGTPLPTWVYLTARLLIVLVMVAWQTALIVLLSRMILLPVSLNWLYVLLTVLGGTVFFSSVALAIANLIPNGDAAPAVCNGLFFPMMFLAGSFFPIDGTPAFIRAISLVDPATYLVDAMHRLYTGQGMGLSHSYGYLVVLAWLVGSLYFAVTRFRWENAR